MTHNIFILSLSFVPVNYLGISGVFFKKVNKFQRLTLYRYMVIFNPDNSSHDIYIVPRYQSNPATLRVDLYDENDRTTATVVPEDTDFLGIYLQVRIKRPVSEGDSFGIKIYDSANNDLIYWRGKAFCTTQTTQQYRING